MYLIQLLLPATVPPGSPSDDPFARTRTEIVAAFGGVTAYSRSAAKGIWQSPTGEQEDDVVMVEVVAAAFDRAWWGPYAKVLARRFAQEVIHVRAMRIDMLDTDAV